MRVGTTCFVMCAFALQVTYADELSGALDEQLAAVADHAALPKVLIIGDSISIGYADPVRRRLEKEADVCRIPGNGQSTDFGLQNIDAWLGDEKWDLIHFNWGIWDTHIIEGERIRNTTEAYRANLQQLVERLKATGATLVWATTTPVQFDTFRDGLGVEKKNIAIYNDVAKSVMEDFQIPIDDLYNRALPTLRALQEEDGVHFTADGSGFLADQVVDSIRQGLDARKATAHETTGRPPIPRVMRNVLLWPAGPIADFDRIDTLDINTLHTFPRISNKSDGLKPIDLTKEWIENQWAADVVRLHEMGIRVWGSISSTGFYPDMFKEHGLDPERFYARDPQGNPQMMLGGSFGKDVMSGCYNNPDWMELLGANTLAYVNMGIDGLWYDVGGYADGAVLYCHCQYCLDSWKKCVEESGLPLDTALPRLESAKDFTQNVNRVHLRWRYGIWEKGFRKLREAAKAINPDLLFLHNLSAMPDGIGAEGAYFVAITKLYDAAHWEEFGHGAAPYSLLPSYFLGKMAAGDRPVVLVQNDQPPRTEIQHRIALAEAYAAGGVLQNRNFPDANHHFYQYLKQHEALYAGQVSIATVGVMTSIWSRNFYENAAYVKPAYWMGWLLQDLHIPYDYLLAERDFTPESLARYKAIVLPDLAVMDDGQLSVLRDYIERGGRVLATHNTAKYDSEMKETGRARLAQLLGEAADASVRVEIGAGRIAYDPGYPEKEYALANPRDLATSPRLAAPGEPNEGIRGELDWLTDGILPVDVTARATTAVIPQRQGANILLQCINYNTYPDGKQITKDEGVRIAVTLAQGQKIKSANALSPDVEGFAAEVSLNQTDGSATVELPTLETYTLVVLETEAQR